MKYLVSWPNASRKAALTVVDCDQPFQRVLRPRLDTSHVSRLSLTFSDLCVHNEALCSFI